MGAWIPGPDSVARCGDDPGAVGNERLIKFVSTGEWDAAKSQLNDNALKRERLCETVDFADNCGDSEGLSVERADGLDNQEITERCDAHFANRKGTAECSVGALASELRAVRLQGHPDVQVVFVFDDPMVKNTAHAVIRIRPPSKPKPPVDFIRQRLKAIFKRIG